MCVNCLTFIIFIKNLILEMHQYQKKVYICTRFPVRVTTGRCEKAFVLVRKLKFRQNITQGQLY